MRTASRKRCRYRLVPLRYRPAPALALHTTRSPLTTLPYRYARIDYVASTGGWLKKGSKTYLDHSRDLRPENLARWGLPPLETPEQLAAELEIPLGTLAWLIHRHENGRPAAVAKSHYYYKWLPKRLMGYRLLEIPKTQLREVQRRVLHQILAKVPVHAAAHGFVRGRSTRTNARPHVGQAVVVKLDLANFFPGVTYNRVVAIFRQLGFSREVALWLGQLCITAAPPNLPAPEGKVAHLAPYTARHLPQGAPTSPAIANLSAYALDLRLSGLAKAYGGTYTRYADDLTFSGPDSFARGLHQFLPLVKKIIRAERFRINFEKRRILRPHTRQHVTGIVVNERPNIRRREFDCLKAILTNCAETGPAVQNRQQHPNFAAYLTGRIGYIASLNPARGAKLMALYRQIDWDRR